MNTIQLRDAKATLSAVVAAAERGEATTITRHGVAAAVLVPVDVARRLYAKETPSFAALLMICPEVIEEFRNDPGLRDLDV